MAPDLHDDDGLALLSVLGFMVVVLFLAGVAMNLAITSHRQSYGFANNNAALSVADAGLDDYLARLNRVPNYYAVATPASPGDNDALAGWAAMEDGPGEYHVDVDASTTSRDGALRVRSTGRVGDEVRTVETVFRQDGFLDNIYFTEYEVLDPHVFGNPVADCSRYRYAGRSDATCGTIRFFSGDTIDGPLRTNDSILLDGTPTFRGEAVTGWPGPTGAGGCTTAGNQLWLDDSPSGNSTPDFQRDLCHEAPIPMPSDNQTIRDQTTGATPGTSGCAYYGPTYIELYDPNPAVDNDGRMRVRSPYSRSHPAGARPTDPGRCGTSVELRSVTGADRPLPTNGVVYVDTNTWLGCPSGHPLGMPRSLDDTGYSCSAGDAFVWGTLDGQLTIGAGNDVVVVWDTVYAESFPDTDDMLGLVATNDVEVYHPVDGSTNLAVVGTATGPLPPFIPGRYPSTGPSRTWDDPEIHAAIMAVRRTFRVQRHGQGAAFPGDLTVRGAIAQLYRGAVSTGSGASIASGYDKDYVYDDRLEFLSPPYFVQPGGDTKWEDRTWAELPPPDDLPA